MTLHLHEITNNPKYFPAMAHLKYSAFKEHNLFTQVVFADCADADVDDWFVRREYKDMREEAENRWRIVGCFVKQEKDEGEGELVAYAKWSMPLPESVAVRDGGDSGEPAVVAADVKAEKEEGEDEFGLPSLPPGANLEVHRRYRESLRKNAHDRRDVVGEWYLVSLSTAPSFAGRGAGSMLLEWGQDQARREGKGVFLASSPQAVNFYTKRGFKEVGRDRVYFDDNGEEGRWEEGVMMRWNP